MNTICETFKFLISTIIKVLLFQLLLFTACNTNIEKYKTTNNIITFNTKSQFLVPEKENYSDYKVLFKKVYLPFTFNTDSLDNGYFYGMNDDICDSIGNSMSETLIPRYMVKRWILGASKNNKRDELNVFMKDQNLDRYYNDEFYWQTITPFIRFELADKDILYVMIYNQTSYMNGGFTCLWAVTYSKQGDIISSKAIGYYGYYETKDVKDDGNIETWKRTTDNTSMQVNVFSTDKIAVTSTKTREIEMQIYGDVEKDYTTRKMLDKKSEMIVL